MRIMHIEAVVATAGYSRGLDGTVFDANCLRSMANGKTLFWDEERQSLIYRGAGPQVSGPEDNLPGRSIVAQIMDEPKAGGIIDAADSLNASLGRRRIQR